MKNNRKSLRGNYEQARPDFTVAQDYAAYSAAEQQTWRVLYKRQRTLVQQMGCAEFNLALSELEMTMDFDTAIPCLNKVNQRLTQATGWALVAVPGLIPDREFFKLLSTRRFPVTVWIRRPSEIDYIVEPDLFHDFFGHVPMLFDPSTANFLANYGLQATQASASDLQKLARLYWYTIEFGLVQQSSGRKAFGAGLLSSRSELDYALNNQHLHRPFERFAVSNQTYLIDTFQTNYFVIPNLSTLCLELNIDSLQAI
jgi:phenylalanine-4-hydroxylase